MSVDAYSGAEVARATAQRSSRWTPGRAVADFTGAELVIPMMRSPGPADALNELCQRLLQEGRIADSERFHAAALNRELLSSTVVAPGWAMPHARISDAKELCFALGKTTAPMRWFGNGEHLVRLVFLFAIPDRSAGEYLSLVSGLAQLSQDEASCERLVTSTSADAIISVLKEAKLNRPPG